MLEHRGFDEADAASHVPNVGHWFLADPQRIADPEAAVQAVDREPGEYAVRQRLRLRKQAPLQGADLLHRERVRALSHALLSQASGLRPNAARTREDPVDVLHVQEASAEPQAAAETEAARRGRAGGMLQVHEHSRLAQRERGVAGRVGPVHVQPEARRALQERARRLHGEDPAQLAGDAVGRVGQIDIEKGPEMPSACPDQEGGPNADRTVHLGGVLHLWRELLRDHPPRWRWPR